MWLYVSIVPCGLHGLEEACYVAVCVYTYPADCMAWRRPAMWMYASIFTLQAVRGAWRKSAMCVSIFTMQAVRGTWRKPAMWLYVSIPTLHIAWHGGGQLCSCMYLYLLYAVCIYTYPADCEARRRPAMMLNVSILFGHPASLKSRWENFAEREDHEKRDQK